MCVRAHAHLSYECVCVCFTIVCMNRYVITYFYATDFCMNILIIAFFFSLKGFESLKFYVIILCVNRLVAF